MDPTNWLPHRPPFLLVDDVEITDTGYRATGTWTPGEERYAGHFPGRPMLPGVLQVESIAQVGACALIAGGIDGLPVFAGLDRVRFKRPVLPGDRLDIVVELDEFRHRVGSGRGSASVYGKLVCDAALRFAVIPNPEHDAVIELN